jgi:hypothetical protein
MVELIRRVIPRDIVGGDVQRLRRMDALVHVLYEVAGTAGAFTSSSLISKFGYNYSYMFSPIFFGLAGLTWRFVGSLGHQNVGLTELEKEEHADDSIFKQMVDAVRAFGKAFYVGMFLVFSHRRFVWLVSGYSFALYGHR